MMKLTTLFFPGNIMTNLEKMITTRVVSQSIISNISSEFSIEKIIIEATHFNYQSHNWILSVFIIYSYGYFKYIEGMNTNTKIQQTKIYGKYNQYIRQLIFIMFIIFSRDVQSVI